MQNSYMKFAPHWLFYHTQQNVLFFLFLFVIYLEASLNTTDPYAFKISLIRLLIDNFILVLFFAINLQNSRALSAQPDRSAIFGRAMFIVNAYKIPALAFFYYFQIDSTDPTYLVPFILYEAFVNVFVYSVLSRQKTPIKYLVCIYALAKVIAYLIKSGMDIV